MNDALRKPFRLALAAGLASLALAVVASAASAPPEPVRLSYAAEGNCPDQRAFLDELYSRAHRIRPAVDTDRPWSIRVEVRSGDEASVGTVQVDGPDGTSTTRKMQGRDCKEVVTALALVTALAIDPYGDVPRECPKSSAPAASSMPAASSSTRVPRSATTSDPAFDEPVVRRGQARSSSDRTWLTGAGYTAMGAIAPGLVSGGSVFVGYEPARNTLFAPRFRVSLSYLPPSSTVVEAQEARTSWIGARVQGCPVRFSSGSASLMPCLTAGFGSATVEGRTNGGTRSSLGWADLGGALQWQIDLADWLVLDAHGGLIVPLTRYTTVFDYPPVTVYKTPELGGEISAGLAVRFP